MASPLETKDGKNDKPPLTFPKTVIAGAGRTKSFFSASIYRVPGHLRERNKSAYTPRLVSIGPFHKHLESLEAQDLKMWYVNSFAGRMAVGLREPELAARKLDVLNKCKGEMTNDLDIAKQHYAEKVGDKLTAEMLVIDGCFILEILCRHKAGKTSNSKTNGGEEISIEQPTDDPSCDSTLICNTGCGEEIRMKQPTLSWSSLFNCCLPHSVSIEQPTIDPILESLLISDSSRGEEISIEQPKPSCSSRFDDCPPPLVSSSSHLVGHSPQPTKRGEEINSEQPTDDDPIFDNKLIFKTVQIDLLLLENQIPFFVLEKLFSLTLGSIKNLLDPPSDLILDYIIPYFSNVMVPKCYKSADTDVKICCCLPKDFVISIVFGKTDGKKSKPKATEETEKKNDHILQILHDHNLPPPHKGKRERNDLEFVSSASELEYSGVKFLAGSGQDLSEIHFDKEKGPFSSFRPGKFTIPWLLIEDTTEPVLRNLIAFEQCHPKASVYFTSYAALMDMLVSSEKDVEVLEKANVIRELLGSKKDVCDLFNNITKEIVTRDFIYFETCQKARKYSEGEWSKFMAQLRRKWFASPWTFIAFCVAGLLFGISVTQFILSFLT